jgi:hypothetical protein
LKWYYGLVLFALLAVLSLARYRSATSELFVFSNTPGAG